MKQVLQFSLISLIVLTLSNCAGGKDIALEKDPPFSIEKAYYQHWVSGIEGGGSGTNVHIELSEIQNPIQVLDIYFGDKGTAAIQKKNEIAQYTGFFINSKRQDVIMDESPIKESANVPEKKSPFPLDKDEAIISYQWKGQTHYVKVENLIEEPMIAYPGANIQDKN